MSLFKPFKGHRSGLDAVTKKDGNAYFCVDDGSFWIDYTDENGALQRKQTSAKDAETLTGKTAEELIAAANKVQANLDTHIKVANPHGISPETIGAATASALSTHTEDVSNPHNVTKSQVGLGNVPNVSTNNQTPSYTAATSLTDLASGEKLSTAFGKIAKAISELMSHIDNKENPHQVTAAQVGADPAGSADAVQANLTAHTTATNPHGLKYAAASQAGGAATSAEKLTADNGSEKQPVYFKDGIPVACGNTLDVSISGTAAKATADENGKNIAGTYATVERIEPLETFLNDANVDTSDKNVINTLKEIQEYITSDQTGASEMLGSIQANSKAIDTHLLDKNNPHNVTDITGNAGTATKLKNTKYIDGVSFVGDANVTRYATCSTAKGTAAKTASITAGTFSLATGARVTVKFTYENTAASPTLNIGGTGAKAIYWHGAALASSQYWQAGAVLDFVYNGTQWELVGVAKDNNVAVDTALSASSTNPVQNKVVNTALSGKAPTSHAAEDTTYGAGSETNYGHVKLSDLTNDTSDANSGIAASPKAVKAAYDLAASKEVNQNAFSNVTVGSTTIAADSKTDTLTLVAGSNVTLTPDATNDKITIASSHPTITKSTDSTSTAVPEHGRTFTAVDSVTRDSNGHVTKINTKTITLPDAGLHYVPSDSFTTVAGSDTSGAYLAAKWSVSDVDSITTPTDGMSIAIRTPVAGNKGGILLSIDGGTTYYPIVRNNTTLVTTTYAVGSTLILTFNSTQTASPYTTAGTTASVTGCWQIADYDANTTYTNVKLGHGYCTCSTAVGTAAKTASLSSYTLTTGGIVAVRFTNGNTASKPTLNINSKGAKSIYYNGAALTDTSLIKAGDVVTFIYSSQYHIIAINRDTDTVYTLPVATSSALGGVKSGTDITVDSSGNVSVNDNSHNHSAANITSGTIAAARLPSASGTAAGITLVYPAASCTTFSSDTGTVTPLAVQKGAKMFAITRPSSSTNKAITRYSNTTGDVQDSTIIIEDVVNSRDSSNAQVIAIPASGGKKMVYGYCTDQVDGTSFIGGIFDASATEYPYTAGLAIGGSSGNLLWKGSKVATTNDLSPYATLASPTLTGTPKAPTAASGTNTTQIATTAFVQAAIGNAIAASY